MRFAVDPIATSIACITLLLWRFFKQHPFFASPPPSLAFSRLKDLKLPSRRSRLASLPKKLHLVALTSFIIAFIDPHFLFPRLPSSLQTKTAIQPLSIEGLALYLVLDQSGSMREAVRLSDENGRKTSIAKIDVMKEITQQFIQDHPSDLIGLVSFARVPRVLVPLTLDQETLIKQLNQIQVVKHPEEDGTAMGYAIFKTARLISATRHFAQDLPKKEHVPYKIKSAAMIVVTDGFQDPSWLDQGNRLRTLELDDAAQEVKNQNIRLYVINIDPALGTDAYAPQRRQLQAITHLTGGQFYLVTDPRELKEIYATISRLEKGSISYPPQLIEARSYRRFSLYPFFILLGLGALLSALILESTYLKIVP